MKIYPNLSEALAITIKTLRKNKNMNKSVLADFTGVERGYLRDMEKGNRKPTVNTIFCLCQALGIHPVEFFQMVMNELDKINHS